MASWPPPYGQQPPPGFAPRPQFAGAAYGQGYPQGYPPPVYPPQGYPPHGYPPQGYPPQVYPPQVYPPQIQQQQPAQTGTGGGVARAAGLLGLGACLTGLLCSCCPLCFGHPSDDAGEAGVPEGEHFGTPVAPPGMAPGVDPQSDND